MGQRVALPLALDTFYLGKHVVVYGLEDDLLVLPREPRDVVQILGNGEHALLGAIVEQRCILRRRRSLRERGVFSGHDETRGETKCRCLTGKH